MKSWKTSLSGILTIASFALSYFFPQHKEFFIGISTVAVSTGLLAAKDSNVTGGTISQPTVSNPPTKIEE